MEFRYTYLLMALTFFIVWLILFIWRKNTRKEMIIMSLVFTLAGPLTEVVYTQDWWKPLTLTNTAIGPESLVAGFMIGGIASVIYEDIFKKKIKIRRIGKVKKEKENFLFILIILISAALLFGSFYLLKVNSLVATIVATLIPTFFIWIKRKDLILDSLATGILLVIVASFVYSVLEFLTPDWVHAFWYFKNIPNIIIFNLPLDDIVWYFFTGLFVGPLYEFWKEGKLSKEI